MPVSSPFSHCCCIWALPHRRERRTGCRLHERTGMPVTADIGATAQLYTPTKPDSRLRAGILPGRNGASAWLLDCCARAMRLPFVEPLQDSSGSVADILIDPVCDGDIDLQNWMDGTDLPVLGILRVERCLTGTGVSDLLLAHQTFDIEVRLYRTRAGGRGISPDGEIIYRSFESFQLSVHEERNSRAVDEASATCLARALRRLHAGCRPFAPETGGEPVGRCGGRGWLYRARRLAVSVKGNIDARSGGSRWVLSWRRAAAGDLPGFEENSIAAAPFRLVELPDDGEAADPFAVMHDGGLYLFFERVPPGGARGELACAVFDEGRLRDVREVMVQPFHLSYPQVFEAEGDWWMIPETGEVKRVDLYRAEHFPDRWIRERTLLEGHSMVDATVHRKDGLWYMMVTVDEGGFHREWALFVFMAETLRGPWRPHPLNPVRSDVRDTRGAGPLFEHRGRLLRPAQDGSRGYGSSLAFLHVTELSPQGYAEERIASFRPDNMGPIRGCHTFSQAGGMQFIDIRVKR